MKWVGIAFVLAFLRPLIWALFIAIPLWLARRLGMSDSTGRFIFGHYWDAKYPNRPGPASP